MNKSRKHSTKTRSRLMDSACTLFLKYGYNAVSMEQIATDIGSTRGAFYWHFDSKEAILCAICEREGIFIEGLMVNLFLEKNLSPDLHIKHILNQLVENFFRNQRFRNYVELTWFKVEHLQQLPINTMKRISNEYFITESRDLVLKGKHLGLFKDGLDPHVSAVQMATLINGIYRLYFISPQNMDKSIALAIVHQFWESMCSGK